MASKKQFWSRRCDKPRRNIARKSYWFKWPSARREAVLPGSKLTRTIVRDELKNRGVRTTAPNVFCARPRMLHFGIA